MKRSSRLLTVALCVLLAACLVLALFSVGAHIHEGHDHDECPVCAVLGLVAAVCIVVAYRIKTSLSIPRATSVSVSVCSRPSLSTVRLNC